MTEGSVRRYAGAFGLAASLLLLLQIPLYFMYSGAPPDWNILTRILLSACGSTLLIVFLAGFRQVIRQANPEYDWVATVAFAASLVWLTLSMVAQSMEAGTAIASEVPIDPTTQGPLAPGQFLMWGSIGRLMSALFLAAAGMSILRTRLLPVWTGRAAYAIALINLAFVPSMYFGRDAARFYSAVGWGTTATVPGLILCWILAASVVMFRNPGQAHDPM
jgi:hypothetical protein